MADLQEPHATPRAAADGGRAGASVDMLLELGRRAWEERWRILKVGALFAIGGVVVALASRPEYTAGTKIVPYRSGAGISSTLSGLSGLAGIRLPSGMSDPTISAELYPDVFSSTDFRVSLAETKIPFSTLGRTMTIREYFLAHPDSPVRDALQGALVDAPRELLSGLVDRGGGANVADSIARQEKLPRYDRKYLRILRTLEDRLEMTMNRKTYVIEIRGTMPDPVAAAELVRSASSHLMQEIIDFEARKAGEQLRFVSEQLGAAKLRYETSQRNLASFNDRNRMLMTATSRVEQERLQREYDLAFEVYQQLSREVEQARIKKNQDTPVFTVLDQVVVPSQRTSPRRARIVLVALLLGLAVGVGRVAWSQLRREWRYAAAR